MNWVTLDARDSHTVSEEKDVQGRLGIAIEYQHIQSLIKKKSCDFNNSHKMNLLVITGLLVGALRGA